jgi:hypothetical protein
MGKRHVHSGQAMVEFAIVLTLMLLVIFGGVTFIQYVGSQYAIAQAARNAAHVAALRGSTGGLPDNQWVSLASAPGPVAHSVRDTFAGSPFVTVADAEIRATCATSPCRRYSNITISIRYYAQAWTPFPGIPNPIRLSADASRTAEQDSQGE